MNGEPVASADMRPIEVDARGQPINREMPLRKKRSIKRLFTISRQGDSKSSKSPAAAYEIASPTTPVPPPQAITSQQATPPREDAWSHKRSISASGVPLPPDADATAWTEREQEADPRASTSTSRSNKITNFSRPSRDRRNTLSVDEGRNGYSRTPTTPAGVRSSQASDASCPSISLGGRPSYDRLNGSPMQLKSSPPRPHTATPDSRSSVTRDIPRVPALPRGSKVNGVDLMGPPTIPDELRASMRSGTSTWSSGFDIGSTKHSSVFTKMSSVRDSTTTAETSDSDFGKASLSVDEPFDFNFRGADNTGDSEFRKNSFAGTDMEQRTYRIAQAMNEPLGLTSLSRVTTNETAPAPSKAPGPPALLPPTATHDQYGFRKASREVTVAAYDAWHKEYSKQQTRRTARWMSLMKSHGMATTRPKTFPQRSSKVQRFVRKGVPPKWRGDLWYYYAGGESYANRFPGLYDELVAASSTQQLPTTDKEAIDRDIHRTFPDNIHYKPESAIIEEVESPMLRSLRRLLYAFAIHHPRIGYCQSLNFLAGLLLLFLPEERAFWLLHIITARHLPGTHEISLEGANVDLWVLMLALKDELPNVWSKIGGGDSVPTEPSRLPPVSLCTTPWFMSLFIGTLPIESVLRMWDLLFYEGSASIFRAALAIFRLGEAEIARVTDPMEIFQVVQALPRRLLDATTLANMTTGPRGPSGTWLERKRRDRRAGYAEERAAENKRRQSGDAPASTDDIPTGRPSTTQQSVMRSLPATRSVGDLSRTKNKNLFIRPLEPVPPLRKEALGVLGGGPVTTTTTASTSSTARDLAF